MTATTELDLDVHFYSLDKVALILGCSVRTVRRYINDGKLQAVRLGGPDGRLRVRADEVQRFAHSWPARRKLRSLLAGSDRD